MLLIIEYVLEGENIVFFVADLLCIVVGSGEVAGDGEFSGGFETRFIG